MNFTFGIITAYDDLQRLSDIIDSIRELKIPNYEILVMGNDTYLPTDDTTYVDMSSEHQYVTNKKNRIAEMAKYDNLVILHDYYLFDKDWYTGYETFGDEWDVCSNPQYLINGKRHFTDWVTWDHPDYPRWTSLDYDNWLETKYMYQSGGYMLVKKDFLLKYPCKQNMLWGTAEDVEWSLRMRDHADWKCNKLSKVQHNKVHRDAK
jgi:hypothetical protein